MGGYYKSIFTSVFFYVIVAVAIVNLAIVIMWSPENYHGGMDNQGQIVAFSLASPTSTITLLGILFALLALQARPSEVLIVCFCFVGLLMHFIVFIIQMIFVINYKNDQVTTMMVLSIICVIGYLALLVMELIHEAKPINEGPD